MLIYKNAFTSFNGAHKNTNMMDRHMLLEESAANQIKNTHLFWE